MRPRLNGWQRLWVVTASLWTLLVLVVSYLVWPTMGDLSAAEIINRSTFVSDAEVRAQLSPAENAVLKDPEDIIVAKLGGAPGMKIVTDPKDPDFGLPSYDYFGIAKGRARPPDLDAAGHPIGKPPEADPQTLAQAVRAKYPGAYDDLSDAELESKVRAKYPTATAANPQPVATPPAYQHAASITRTIVTRTLLGAKRARMAGVAVAAWAIPVASLYALGWSVGWIRRGFQPATGAK